MKFSPSFQRGKLPDGGAGVDAATAAAIGLVALTASSTVSPSLLPAAGFAGAAGAGGASTVVASGAGAEAAAWFSAGGVSWPQAAHRRKAANRKGANLFIVDPARKR